MEGEKKRKRVPKKPVLKPVTIDKVLFKDGKIYVLDVDINEAMMSKLTELSLLNREAKKIIEEILGGYVDISINMSLVPSLKYMEESNGRSE